MAMREKIKAEGVIVFWFIWGNAMYNIFLVCNNSLQECLKSLVCIFIAIGKRFVQFDPAFEVGFAVFHMRAWV